MEHAPVAPPLRRAPRVVRDAVAFFGLFPRTEDCINVRALRLHALDAAHLRRTISGAWRFHSLLDLAVLTAGLRRAVARYPPVAGWVEAGRAPGELAPKWDAAAEGRGVAWFRAASPGRPPALDNEMGMYDAKCVPALRRHCLMAIQATHFPEVGATLLVASAFMDFLSAWCNECGAEAQAAASRHGGASKDAGGAAARARSPAPPPPPPVWDRRLLAVGAAASGGSSGSASPASSLDGGGSFGSSASGAKGGAAAGGQAPGRAGAARSMGGTSLSRTGSLSSVYGLSFLPQRSGPSLDAASWGGPAVWHVDVLSRAQNAAMLLYGMVSVINARTQAWLLRRRVADELKARLGGAMSKGAPPTGNDVISVLVVASAAWANPRKAAARGGLNAHIVVNARGRFGTAAGPDYFGSNSVLVPVWCPIDLLPAPGAATPYPTPALVAHIHDGLRAAIADPAGIVAARYEWMAAAAGAGVCGRVRACEAAALLAGDVCVDNVANYPSFSLKFGGPRVAEACATRFTPCTRLAWVMPAGPVADRGAGGASGDLRVSLPLKKREWARLAPHWEALGLEHIKTSLTCFAAFFQPAAVRNYFAEVTRTPLGGW
ncbi:MAG: hypothetical protein J3K34DRAFT_507115 [Monoraphidium minutum]|nr:MAG: hypothetical protein J3K34DRAFT_507115 [Monoraphidium minutum]